MKTALICGISGQDGAYLAKLLIEQNYLVWGTSRDAQMSSFTNLSLLGIKEKVKLASMSLNDFRSVLQILTKVQPDEIYNLAGQTSVGLSFDQPVETLESIATGTLNLLEAIRFTGAKIKLYNAGSGECFGDTGGNTANEETPFRPRSPYGVAKATAFWEVANYREAYNLFACSGILYNHESPLRPERFVTQKIVATAVNIAQGSQEKLYLGDISVKRDWGWTPEYVQAMYLMLQQAIPDDYVIATGTSYPLENFIQKVFECLNLDWQKYVVIDQKLYRPTDIAFGGGDPSKAKYQLGWIPQYTMPDVARFMVEARLNPNLINNS
jgi:GDPmannose 4,6-dehydratase